jgi:hypothetical protein
MRADLKRPRAAAASFCVLLSGAPPLPTLYAELAGCI